MLKDKEWKIIMALINSEYLHAANADILKQIKLVFWHHIYTFSQSW